ncbi:MAG: glycerol-3-phosphate dehydrogenase/oxidase [Gemmatimonadota bacterium]
MRRDLTAMPGRAYDLLIIGGGITGACIARDAALRGLSVAIVDKGDWSHATSASSSKLVHGGLRYLKTMELGLIRESLRERRIWEQIAPHMVAPLPFLIPAIRASPGDRLVLGAGLTLYDLLSFDRGRLADPDQRIPRHRRLCRAQAALLEPMLDLPGLNGAFLYYDCMMYSPERLGLECIIDAVEHGADAASYTEVTAFIGGPSGIGGVRVRDLLTGAELSLNARLTVNASGPWADSLLGLVRERPHSRQLVRSKGIHLIVPALTERHALTVAHNGGHFFVLPWRGRSILGTTDTLSDDSPDNVGVSEADIDTFLAFVTKGLPSVRLTRADVLHSYAGLRPLVDDGTTSSYNASRRAEIVDHGAEGMPGLISTIGGKWTTSRALAAKTVDLVQAKLRQPRSDPGTEMKPLPGGATGPIAAFRRDAARAHPATPGPILTNLTQNYGARYQRVLARADGATSLSAPMANHFPDIGAQVIYAVRDEMALKLEDVIFRRTGLGTLGHPGPALLSAVADLMAAELSWTPADTMREIGAVEARYASNAGIR